MADLRDRTTITYMDSTETVQGRTYYYIVEAVDSYGGFSRSNEVSATLQDIPPRPVSLQADSLGTTRVPLSWSRNWDRDFKSYVICRSRAVGVAEGDSLASVPDSYVTMWVDDGVQAGTTYFYRLFVHDEAGHSSPSNEVKVKTRP